MKKNLLFRLTVLLILVFGSQSASPQAKTKPLTSFSAQIITKWSNSVRLTEEQKTKISAKLDSVGNKFNKSIIDQRDSSFTNGINRFRQIVLDSILTAEQKQTLKNNEETKKKEAYAKALFVYRGKK